MEKKRFIIVVSVIACVIALAVTGVVYAGSRLGGDDIRDLGGTSIGETINEADDIPVTSEPTIPVETEDDNDTSNDNSGKTTDAENDETSDTTVSTTPTAPTAPNYTPTKNISGEADVVKDSNSGSTSNVVVDNEDTTHYEDADVDAIVIPPVITPGVTFGYDNDTSDTTADSTATTLRTDVVTPPAMDDNTSVTEEITGVELEEVEEEEMPDFLP